MMAIVMATVDSDCERGRFTAEQPRDNDVLARSMPHLRHPCRKLRYFGARPDRESVRGAEPRGMKRRVIWAASLTRA